MALQWLIAGAVVVLLVLLVSKFKKQRKPNEPPEVGSWIPWLGNVEFFKDPYNFVKNNKEKFGDCFCFKLMGKKITFIGGSDEAREFYFGAKNEDLHFTEGYKGLWGPLLGEEFFYDKPGLLTGVLAGPRIKASIPILVEETNNLLNGWGKEGHFEDIFKEIYRIVFKQSCLVVGCREVAFEHFEKFTKLYSFFESGYGALQLLFPALSKGREKAKREMIQLFYSIVTKRFENPDRIEDALQVVMDWRKITKESVNEKDIENLGFDMFSLLFAAQTNTAVVAAWALVCLMLNDNWRKKCIDEINQEMEKEGGELNMKVLGNLPILEACMKEAMRLNLHGPTWRYVKKPLKYKDYEIPEGSYAMHTLWLPHLDKTSWDNVGKFDPQTHMLDDIERKKHIFVGFGSGTHPCLGMKLATYEVLIFLILALKRFDFSMESQQMPEVNRANLHGAWAIKPVPISYHTR